MTKTYDVSTNYLLKAAKRRAHVYLTDGSVRIIFRGAGGAIDGVFTTAQYARGVFNAETDAKLMSAVAAINWMHEQEFLDETLA